MTPLLVTLRFENDEANFYKTGTGVRITAPSYLRNQLFQYAADGHRNFILHPTVGAEQPYRIEVAQTKEPERPKLISEGIVRWIGERPIESVDDVALVIAALVGYLPDLRITTENDINRLMVSYTGEEYETPEQVHETIMQQMPGDRLIELYVWRRRDATRTDLIRIRDLIWQKETEQAAKLITEILENDEGYKSIEHPAQPEERIGTHIDEDTLPHGNCVDPARCDCECDACMSEWLRAGRPGAGAMEQKGGIPK